jgi:hypothetical protein
MRGSHLWFLRGHASVPGSLSTKKRLEERGLGIGQGVARLSENVDYFRFVLPEYNL